MYIALRASLLRPQRHVLAYDGIAVIVNLENPVSDLDVQTIAQIYTGEITNWSEVGGNDAEIVLIGREAGSGTRDGFESITGTEDACQYRQELTSTGDVITAVSQNPGAIGYASVASVKDTVKAVTVGGVAPSNETILDGTYVIQRPFVLVTKADLFLTHPGIAFTREQLLSIVWNIEYQAETRTVDMHIRTLRQKLGSYGHIVETVRNVGYRLEKQSDV